MYWNDDEMALFVYAHKLNSNIRCIEIRKMCNNATRKYRWIVTLDVLKYGKDYLKDVRKALNSNIRCIEMGVKGDTGAAGKELNSNIRCIEI